MKKEEKEPWNLLSAPAWAREGGMPGTGSGEKGRLGLVSLKCYFLGASGWCLGGLSPPRGLEQTLQGLVLVGSAPAFSTECGRS